MPEQLARWTRGEVGGQSSSLELLWFAVLSIVGTLNSSALQHDEEGTSTPTEDVREIVRPYMIKLAAAYLDQGVSQWNLPSRESELLDAFFDLLRHDTPMRASWLRDSANRLYRSFSGLNASDIILRELEHLGIGPDHAEEFLREEALALRGWAGMVYTLEQRPQLLTHYPGKVSPSFADFMAVRLMLEDAAFEFQGHQPNSEEDLADHVDLHRLGTAYQLFRVCQRVGVTAEDIFEGDREVREQVVQLVTMCTEVKRRQVWHEAYEHNLETRFLDAILIHREHQPKSQPRRTPRFQMTFCIDDREESLRRYIEDLGEEWETFGTAGFFGIDAEFEGPLQLRAPFCPVNLIPEHRIVEAPTAASQRAVAALRGFSDSHNTRAGPDRRRSSVVG